MDEQTMQKLKHELCNIVKDYAEKGIGNAQALGEVKTALSALSKVYTIEAMERVGGSYSNRYYEKGNSYRRDSMGRYADSGEYQNGRYADERYSGDLKEKLCRMMENAGPEEKEMIRAFLNKM